MPIRLPLNQRLYVYRAKCLRVVDGDTLDLDIDLGLKVHSHTRVRLFGIDTPETYGVKHDSEEYAAGVKAREFVVEVLRHGDLYPEPAEMWVETHKDKTGKYGRYLATIWIEDACVDLVCLNDLLVNGGLAERKDY